MPIGRLDHYARVMAETERGNKMENVEREDLTILGCDCHKLKAENDRLREVVDEWVKQFKDLQDRGFDLLLCLGPTYCDQCGLMFHDNPGNCTLADHIEAYEAIRKYNQFNEGRSNQ